MRRRFTPIDSARSVARAATIGSVLMGSVLLGGCGDLTSGGVGELEVVVAADSVPLAAALLSGLGSDGSTVTAAHRQAPSDPAIEGTLVARVQVFVLRPPGRWVEVTDGVQEVMMSLSGGDPVVVGRSEVPAGPYRAVRTVFRHVRANIESGLEIDGEPITGVVTVDLGSGDRLEVARPADFDVSDGMASSLAIDLHARRWLRLLDRDVRRVRTDDFEGELRFRHRP